MSKKRRTKRYDPRAAIRRQMTGTTIWAWEGLRDVNDAPLQRGMWKSQRAYEELSDAEIAGAMYERGLKWFYFVRALCKAPDGKVWVSMSQHKEIATMLHGNGDGYHWMRDDVLSLQRRDQVVDVGWLAQVYRGASPADDPEKLEAMRQFEIGGITDYRQEVWRYVDAEVVNDPDRRAA